MNFKEPIVVGTFNDVLTNKVKRRLICDMVFGGEMMIIYKQYRDNFHITSVVEMLKEMETIFAEWNQCNKQ
jgi:hypothetical protein